MNLRLISGTDSEAAILSDLSPNSSMRYRRVRKRSHGPPTTNARLFDRDPPWHKQTFREVSLTSLTREWFADWSPPVCSPLAPPQRAIKCTPRGDSPSHPIPWRAVRPPRKRNRVHKVSRRERPGQPQPTRRLACKTHRQTRPIETPCPPAMAHPPGSFLMVANCQEKLARNIGFTTSAPTPGT